MRCHHLHFVGCPVFSLISWKLKRFAISQDKIPMLSQPAGVLQNQRMNVCVQVVEHLGDDAEIQRMHSTQDKISASKGEK